MVSDRGVLTSARIEQPPPPGRSGSDHRLRAPAIKQLAAAGGPLQPSLFDDRDIRFAHTGAQISGIEFFYTIKREGLGFPAQPSYRRENFPLPLR